MPLNIPTLTGPCQWRPQGYSQPFCICLFRWHPDLYTFYAGANSLWAVLQWLLQNELFFQGREMWVTLIHSHLFGIYSYAQNWERRRSEGLPVPESCHQLRRFLGFMKFYRRFPITVPLWPRFTSWPLKWSFIWLTKTQQAFSHLEDWLTLWTLRRSLLTNSLTHFHPLPPSCLFVPVVLRPWAFFWCHASHLTCHSGICTPGCWRSNTLGCQPLLEMPGSMCLLMCLCSSKDNLHLASYILCLSFTIPDHVCPLILSLD